MTSSSAKHAKADVKAEGAKGAKSNGGNTRSSTSNAAINGSAASCHQGTTVDRAGERLAHRDNGGSYSLDRYLTYENRMEALAVTGSSSNRTPGKR